MLPLALALEVESCDSEVRTAPEARTVECRLTEETEGDMRGGESLRKARDRPQRVIWVSLFVCGRQGRLGDSVVDAASERAGRDSSSDS